MIKLNGNSDRFSIYRQIVKIFTITLLMLSSACSADPQVQFSTMETGMPQRVMLPTPITNSEHSLEETLHDRRSVREFMDEPLKLEEISQLMWAAQGITDPRGYRTAPSAGALYPIELYMVTADGLFHYNPQDHSLVQTKEGDLREDLCQAGLSQEAIAEAPAVFVLTAVYERVEVKYGAERTPRYVHLEAGHAAQNLLLQAVSLDLGATPIGAFYDEQVQSVLDLPLDHAPLYLIPVGHPK